MSVIEATVEQRSATGSSKARRCVRAAMLGALIAAIGLLSIGVAGAFADEAPTIEAELQHEEVFSTRAHIEVNVRTGGVEVEWEGEYREEGGKWIEAGHGKDVSGNGGTTFPSLEVFALGEEDATSDNNQQDSILHHLKPSTRYNARFHVWNENRKNETVREFSFETKPIEKPEFPSLRNIGITGGQTFKAKLVYSPTSIETDAQIESNGSATTYKFEYSTTEGGPWTAASASDCSGTVSVEEDFVEVGYQGKSACIIEGLTPETHYFIRLSASNEKGLTQRVQQTITPTAKPLTVAGGTEAFRNVTPTSVDIDGEITPHRLATTWRFEYATSVLGPWMAAPGGLGEITQSEAGATPESRGIHVGAMLTGLSPSTSYYVRLAAKNSAGEAQICTYSGSGAIEGIEENVQICEPVSGSVTGLRTFETDGPPTATAFATHGLHGEDLRLVGAVNPHSSPASCEYTVTPGASSSSFTLSLGSFTTESIASSATPEQVGLALVGSGAVIHWEGRIGGPYTLYCVGESIGIEQPAMTGSGASVVTVQRGGSAGSGVNGFFEYVSQHAFEEGGWSNAISTTPESVGGGTSVSVVGKDLPVLAAGEAYRYRTVAESKAPGGPVVDSQEQSLTVPVPPVVEPVGACPNEALRSGPSVNLPDCRGYEQITPVNKEDAQELYNYGGGVFNGALIGEDGEHVMVDAPAVTWGPGPEAAGSPYFFSHSGQGNWSMVGASLQPQTGVDILTPKLYNANLTRFAFESRAETSEGDGESPDVTFGVGSPGVGSYTEVASVPRDEFGEAHDGWVASSADFSKLILKVDDHTLLGSSTHTLSGADLYEYIEGELHQVNVGIGTCGAKMVSGDEERGTISSAHAVSDDGSRVFFEAVPGKNCSQPSNLYVRIDGERTVDIGPYRFAAANAQGSVVLLEKPGEFFIYQEDMNSDKGSVTAAFPASSIQVGAASEDLAAFYFESTAALTSDALPVTGNELDLYRYDVSSGKLSFILQNVRSPESSKLAVSADGRYAYFQAELVLGLPGGRDGTTQIYRYDNAERVVECVSCASPSDPEPDLSAVVPGVDETLSAVGPDATWDGSPREIFASDNGEYEFFDTPAGLVPADGGTEAAPEGMDGKEHSSEEYSISSDVYEWRRDGVTGCTHLQGCLALITSGRGGYLNLLIGTANEGRDVYFYTKSQLSPSDDDTAGDIYDARVGGGSQPPPPQRPECVASSCSTPFSAPSDVTPASATFHGPGNVVVGSENVMTPKKKPAATKKAKKKRKRKVRHKAKSGSSRSKARKSAVSPVAGRVGAGRAGRGGA